MMRNDLAGSHLAVSGAIIIALALLAAPAGAGPPVPKHRAANKQGAASGPYNCAVIGVQADAGFDPASKSEVWRNDSGQWNPYQDATYHIPVWYWLDGYDSFFNLEIRTQAGVPYGAGQPKESFANTTFNGDIPPGNFFRAAGWPGAASTWPTAGADFTDHNYCFVGPYLDGDPHLPIIPLSYQPWVNGGGPVPGTESLGSTDQEFSVVVKGTAIALTGPAKAHHLTGLYRLLVRSVNMGDGNGWVPYD
jgi:hypothetical protein